MGGIYNTKPIEQQLAFVKFREPSKRELLWRKALGLNVYTGKSSSGLARFATTVGLLLMPEQRGTRAEGNIKAEREAAAKRVAAIAKLGADAALLIGSAGTFGALGAAGGAVAGGAQATTQGAAQGATINNLFQMATQALMQQQQQKQQQQNGNITPQDINSMIPLLGNVLGDIFQIYDATVNVDYNKYDVFKNKLNK